MSSGPVARRDVLAASTIDNLFPLAVALCIFYGGITVLHVLLQQGLVLHVMAPVAAASCLITGVIAVALRHRGRVGLASGPAWVALLSSISMGNSVLHLAITDDPKQTTTVMMSMTLVAAVLHNRWWSMAVIGFGLIGWVLVAVTSPPAGDWVHYFISILMSLAIAGFLYYSRTRTVLRLAEAERRLQEMAQTDELTGLLNRRGLLVRGEQLLEQAQELGESPTAVFVDMDGLKQVNDQQGHEAGDRLIAAVGRALRQTLPEEVLISRWGGDEFAMLMPGGGAQAAPLIERIQQRLSADGIEVSAGAAQLAEPDGGLSDLLARADLEMYQVKQLRRQARAKPPADSPGVGGVAPTRA